MFGKTNSFVVSGSSGGGDVVDAINNTGGVLEKGDKVWLNKHNLDENEAYQYQRKASSSVYYGFWIVGSDIYWASSNKNIGNYAFNPEAKTWQENTIYTVSTFPANGIIYYGAEKVALSGVSSAAGSSSLIFNNTLGVLFKGIYLGDGLCINSQCKLQQINPETGVFGDELSGALGSTCYGAWRDGNILFYNVSNKQTKVFDVSDKENPVVLADFVTNYLNIVAFTSLNPGGYVFAYPRSLVNYGFGTVTQLAIYQVSDDYQLKIAENLPFELEACIGTACYPIYKPESRILTVGDVNGVYAFRLEDGKLVSLDLTITLPPEAETTKQDTPYIFDISDDLTTAVVAWRSTSSSYYSSYISLYKLTTSADGWFAETFGEVMPQSLTGVVKTGGDVGDKVLVKTTLPEIYRYNLIIEPTPDVIEFVGETV